MNNSKPIFIIGSERSGSNLLRLILNEHPNIAIPHPPHIMKNFYGLVKNYGDLGDGNNFKKLIKDVVRTVELHQYPWEYPVTIKSLNIKKNDLTGIFAAVYEQYLESSGKKRWGCKSTFIIKYIDDIIGLYPRAQFIYLVRDGRDVAVSSKKSIFGHYNVRNSAVLWKNEQQLGIRALKILSEKQIYLLKYEYLIKDPERIVKDICTYLDEHYDRSMLDYAGSSEAIKCAGISISWKNTDSDIIKDNFNKYLKGLSKNDKNIFDGITYDELAYFGYDADIKDIKDTLKKVNSFSYSIKSWWEELYMMMIVQLKHFLKDKNSINRMRKAIFLIKLKLIR